MACNSCADSFPAPGNCLSITYLGIVLPPFPHWFLLDSFAAVLPLPSFSAASTLTASLSMKGEEPGMRVNIRNAAQHLSFCGDGIRRHVANVGASDSLEP